MNVRPASTARTLSRPRREREPFLDWMVLPTLVVLVLVIGYPLVSTLLLSTNQFNLINDVTPSYIGVRNFQDIATDRIFWSAVRNTLYYTFGTVILSALVGTGFALLLENLKGKVANVIRMAVVSPWAVPLTVVAYLFRLMYMQKGGVVNSVLLHLGVIGSPVSWLNDSHLAMPAIVVANIWSTSPFFFLLMAAALSGIPDSVLESARVDRAGVWSTLFHIKLPYLRNPLVIGSMLMIIANFNDFAKVWVMTQGGPGFSTTTLVVYVYRMAFENFDVGYASALGLIWLVLLLFTAIFYFRLLRSRD